MWQARNAEVVPFPVPRHGRGPVGDIRFRALVGEAAWHSLPEATRARFGKRVANYRTSLYAGEIVECRMSSAGWVLAQLCRLIGSPLPLSRDCGLPAVVSVTEDAAHAGQFWTRMYGRSNGFPQVIHSSKRFAGSTGLEEYIGCGFGIALHVEVADGALHFTSDHYFFGRGRFRIRFPRWAEPGHLRISHVDCNHGWFAFALELHHSWFGELISQTVMFHDVETDA
jgi:Domain of unknown function (DUF4166)